MFALFGVTNTSSLRTTESLTSTFNMPYVTPSSPVNHTYDPSGFLLRMRPSFELAIRDIIRYYKWDRVFYVYDSPEGEYCSHVYVCVCVCVCVCWVVVTKFRYTSLNSLACITMYAHMRIAHTAKVMFSEILFFCSQGQGWVSGQMHYSANVTGNEHILATKVLMPVGMGVGGVGELGVWANALFS